MEHSDLVAEMALVERLTTQERLQMARKYVFCCAIITTLVVLRIFARRRRIQQLKLFDQREREWIRSKTNTGRKGYNNPRVPNGEMSKVKRKIFFSDSVMLLEAAARNDIEEGSILNKFLFVIII